MFEVWITFLHLRQSDQFVRDTEAGLCIWNLARLRPCSDKQTFLSVNLYQPDLLGYVLCDLIHITVLCHRHTVHLFQQLIFFSSSFKFAEEKLLYFNSFFNSALKLPWYPVRGGGEHDGGQLVELRVVGVQRLEARGRGGEGGAAPGGGLRGLGLLLLALLAPTGHPFWNIVLYLQRN